MTCPPAPENLRRQVTAYLAAERAATAGYRAAAESVEPRASDGRPAARVARALPWPELPEPPGGSEDLPAAVQAGTVARHLAAVASIAPEPIPGDPRRTMFALQGNEIPDELRALTVLFPGGSPAELALLRILMGTAELPPQWAVGAAHVAPIVAYYRATVELLARAAPDLAAGIARLLATVVVAARRGTGAASSSAAIGGVHMCPRARWTVSKYAELLAHEYVHQALFLDECVHGMFTAGTEQLASAAAQVTSAVRRVPRGYDKSFHAAYVAYVQRRLYARLGEPDPAPAGPLAGTLAELSERRHWLTRHGQSRLAELIELDRRYPE